MAALWDALRTMAVKSARRTRGGATGKEGWEEDALDSAKPESA